MTRREGENLKELEKNNRIGVVSRREEEVIDGITADETTRGENFSSAVARFSTPKLNGFFIAN